MNGDSIYVVIGFGANSVPAEWDVFIRSHTRSRVPIDNLIVISLLYSSFHCNSRIKVFEQARLNSAFEKIFYREKCTLIFYTFGYLLSVSRDEMKPISAWIVYLTKLVIVQ